MNQAQPIFFFLSALFFVVVFYWPWQRLCVEWARQIMFDERDKLFLLSKSSPSMAIDSELHVELRLLIDNTIRFCHKIAWQRFLVDIYIPIETEVPGRFERITTLIKQSDEHTAKALHAIMKQVTFACVVCMMGRSIVLGPVFLCWYLPAKVRTYEGIFRRVFIAIQEGAEREPYGRSSFVKKHIPIRIKA
jgi:hypothetical protein